MCFEMPVLAWEISSDSTGLFAGKPAKRPVKFLKL